MRTTLAFLLCLLPFAARAEDGKKPVYGDAPAAMRAALAAYEAGDKDKALEALHVAVHLVQAETTKDLTAFLKAAPEGFGATEPRSNTTNWSGNGQSVRITTVERTYTRKSDGAEVEVTITNSPQLIQGHTAMLKMLENPQMRAMLEADPNKKVEMIKKHGFEGYSMVEKTGGTNIMLFGKALMIALKTDAHDATLIAAVEGAIDYKGLKGADR